MSSELSRGDLERDVIALVTATIAEDQGAEEMILTGILRGRRAAATLHVQSLYLAVLLEVYAEQFDMTLDDALQRLALMVEEAAAGA